MSRQLDFHAVLTPPRPHRWATLADIEALGVDAADKAAELAAGGPAYSERATDAAFVAMILFGAARILEQRQHTPVGRDNLR